MHRMMVLSSVKHPGKEWKEGALGLDFTHQDYERVSRLTLAYQRAKECTRVCTSMCTHAGQRIMLGVVP